MAILDHPQSKGSWHVAIAKAHRLTREGSGRRFYVAWDCCTAEADGAYVVVDRMPLIGEWFDDGGIRHG